MSIQTPFFFQTIRKGFKGQAMIAQEFSLFSNSAFRRICEQIYGLEELPETKDLTFPLYQKKGVRTKLTNAPYMFQSYPRTEKDCVDLMKIVGSKNNIDIIEIKSDIDISLLGILPSGWFKQSTSLRSDLKLPRNYNLYMESITQKMRSNIHRSIRDMTMTGIDIMDTDQEADFVQFHDLMFMHYQKVEKVPCQPLELFLKLQETFLPQNSIKLKVAKKGHEIVFGALLFSHGNNLEYAYGVTNKKYRSLSPSYAVISQCIEEAILNQASYFSFGASNVQDENLINYKKRWGCETTPLFIFSNYKMSPSEIQTGKSLINKVYSETPAFLVKPFLKQIYRMFV